MGGGKFVYIKETDTFAVADCGFITGFHSAELCMQKAIDIAKERGMYAVFARNANTYGAAFVYTLQAVQQGLIGITMANTPAQMTAFGGNKKMLGTNPISYAIPTKNELPIIFDMACSAVAKSRINEAYNKGEKIPEGWGTNKNGQATIEPEEVLDGGYVLPFANNAKGFGITMMVDLFAGMLSGAACLDEVGFFSSGRMNVGQIFIAIDPTKVYGEDFYERVDEYIRKVKASGENVRIPGENKLRNIHKAEEEGFEIDDEFMFKL